MKNLLNLSLSGLTRVRQELIGSIPTASPGVDFSPYCERYSFVEPIQITLAANPGERMVSRRWKFERDGYLTEFLFMLDIRKAVLTVAADSLVDDRLVGQEKGHLAALEMIGDLCNTTIAPFKLETKIGPVATNLSILSVRSVAAPLDLPISS